MGTQDQYYTRRFTRRHPGLFIILLDQSGSMSERVESRGCSKADFATTAINNLIYEMGQSLIFPGSVREVAHLDPPFGAQMFEASSIIPEPLRQKATVEFGREVVPGARSFIYNADTNVLIKFLHWGTIGAAIE